MAETAISDPVQLTLAELIATQPRHHRGSLAPGERFPSGMRPGRRRAQGVDLDSIGPYVPGDDLRWMDWRATARTGRAQMKRFVAESHLARMLIVDMRGHMFFGTAGQPMAKTAALAAAQLCWEATGLHEPVGLVIVPHGEALRPRRGRGHVLQVMDQIVSDYEQLRNAALASVDDGMGLAAAVDTAAHLLRKGDEICLISDFGGETTALADICRGIADSRLLRAVVVEDALFRRPLRHGRYPLRSDADAPSQVAVIPRHTSAEHRAAADEVRRKLHRSLALMGWHVTRPSGPAIPSGANPP